MTLDKRFYAFDPVPPSGHIGRAYIITNTYGRSLSVYQDLSGEVMRGFPFLPMSEIECGFVTDTTYMKGITCVSFLVPAGSDVPADYHQYSSLSQADFRMS